MHRRALILLTLLGLAAPAHAGLKLAAPGGANTQGLCFESGSSGAMVPCVLKGQDWLKTMLEGSDGTLRSLTATGVVSADTVSAGTISAGSSLKTAPLLAAEAPAPIIDLRSARVWGFSGFSNTGQFSVCSWLGCDPARDIQVVRGLLQGRTTRGALNAESNLALDYWINTGYVPIWKPSTAVATGDYTTTRNEDAYRLYRATVGGTTGTSGGPSGTGTSIPDGTVTWAYIQPGDDTNNKTNFGMTTYVGPGAANSWGMATNVYIDPGFRAQTVVGHENDMSNHGADCTPATRNCFLHLGYVNGPGTITSFSTLSAAGGVTPVAADNSTGGAAFNGVVIDGANAIRNYSFIDGSNSKAAFRCEPGTRKNEACIFDFSDGATGILVKGTKSYAAIDDGSTAPVGLVLEGTYSIAAARYKNWMLGNWGASADYTAMVFNQDFSPAAMMGFFGKPGDATLYSNAPGAFEQRIGNTTTTLTDASQAHFFVPIASTSLAGTGTRYACVNSSGTIVASATACQ